MHLREEFSFDLLEEFSEVDIGVLKGAFECVTINFVVKREHNPSAVRMLHLDVATFPMNLREAKTLQRGQDLPAGKQRHLHKVSSTTSWVPSWASSFGGASR